METLLARCLAHVLDDDGHGIYLRHPVTNETVLVAFNCEGKNSDRTLIRLRRILAGIMYAAIEEDRR